MWKSVFWGAFVVLMLSLVVVFTVSGLWIMGIVLIMALAAGMAFQKKVNAMLFDEESKEGKE
jgi:hypothetical protein